MKYRDTKAALRSLTALAASQGGYFTASQADGKGYAYPHLSYHLSRGNFERAGRGLYRIPTLPLTEHDDLIRLWFWSRGRDDQPQAVFSHKTALALYDLAEFIPTSVHMTVPKSFRKRPPKGCVLHKASLEKRDRREFDVFWATTPRRTLEDLATDPSMPREQFEQAVTDAQRRGLVRKSDTSPLLSRSRSAHRKQPRNGGV